MYPLRGPDRQCRRSIQASPIAPSTNVPWMSSCLYSTGSDSDEPLLMNDCRSCMLDTPTRDVAIFTFSRPDDVRSEESVGVLSTNEVYDPVTIIFPRFAIIAMSTRCRSPMRTLSSVWCAVAKCTRSRRKWTQ